MSEFTKTKIVSNMLKDPLFKESSYTIWTRSDTTWTITNGYARCLINSNSSYINQANLSFIKDQTYKVRYTILSPEQGQTLVGTLTVEFRDSNDILRGTATLQNSVEGTFETTVTLSENAQNIRFKMVPIAGYGYTRIDNVAVALNNQYTTIHSAITALGTSGGSIIVEEGQYPIPLSTSVTTIVVPSDCTISGQGAVEIIVEGDIPAFQNSGHDTDGNERITISGFTIKLDKSGSYSKNLLTMKKIKYCMFENLSVEITTGNPIVGKAAILIEGVSDGDCLGNIISQCTISGDSATSSTKRFPFGIHLIGLCKENIITDNYIVYCSNRCIYLYESQKNILSRNVISNAGESGIYLEGSDYNVVQENQSTYNTADGIFLDQSSYCSINSNICRSNTGGGILLSASMSKNALSNIISSNLSAQNGTSGILLSFCVFYTNVNGNNVFSNALYGIYEDNHSGSNLFAGNICHDNSGTHQMQINNTASSPVVNMM